MLQKYKARVVDNKFVFDNPTQFRLACQALKGEEVAITVQKWRRPRSDNQNAYYWGVVVPILANHFGYLEEELHEALKVMFLTDRTGLIPKVRSTTSLNTAEFEELMSKIRTWASTEHNIFVPLPNEAPL